MANLKVPVIFWLQIFTNADEAHAAQVLSRLGLEDCFQDVICFETLNPPMEPVKCINGTYEEEPQDATETRKNEESSFKTKILCKPSLEAIEAAIRITNVDPKKTVNSKKYLINTFNSTAQHSERLKGVSLFLSQIFFDDSVRNIANGKAAGLHTVIVS